MSETTTERMPAESLTLISGATGFVGGQLLERLEGTAPLRCLVRDPSKLPARDGMSVVEADLSDRDSLPPALEGIDVAYYLVHSMEPGGGAGFRDKDRVAAENFAAVAKDAGIRRIIYLGGLDGGSETSEHLESRTEVAEILEEATVEFVALKASMVVGAGSESFRTLVQLVDRLPVLALPNWRESRSQPVGIEDVVAALAKAPEVEPGSYEIAGADTLSFERMTEIVGDILGKRKRSIPLPFSNSKLESLTASAAVEADSELLEPLMAGLHEDLLVGENALPGTFGIEPQGFETAARDAIESMRNEGAG